MTPIGWEVLLFLLAIAMVLVWLAEIFDEETDCHDCKEGKCIIDDLIVTGIVRPTESEKQ